jgi:hypothetical protein
VWELPAEASAYLHNYMNIWYNPGRKEGPYAQESQDSVLH